MGCCQVNGKCLEPLWSNWSEHTQVCNRPQGMRQYLSRGQWGMVGHIPYLYKNSNSGFAFPIFQGMYLGKEPEVGQQHSNS